MIQEGNSVEVDDSIVSSQADVASESDGNQHKKSFFRSRTIAEEEHVEPNPEKIHECSDCRFKATLLEVEDVTQTLHIDLRCFFYFQPVVKVVINSGRSNVKLRFEHIRNRINWTPHFHFANQTKEVKLIEESYWLDTVTGLVFGRVNYLVNIQQRLDHTSFPFDRHILDVQLYVDNCFIFPWDIKDPCNFPVEMVMDNPHWDSQIELNATADEWDLRGLRTHCFNDELSNNSIVHFQVYVDRHSTYYFWNFATVYFIIVFSEIVVICFPHDQQRFHISMTIALTTVAFKFVTSEFLPKTVYLTLIDKYMLLGLGLVFVRILSDVSIQIRMFDYLPLSEEGLRLKCEEEHTYSMIGNFTVSPCSVDIIVTVIILAVWVFFFVAFFLCSTFPNHFNVRPSWEKLDRRMGVTRNIQRQLTGNNSTDWGWVLEEKENRFEVTDSIRITYSQMQTGSVSQHLDQHFFTPSARKYNVNVSDER